jgi:predicted Zn-dependent peptidase
MSDPRAHAASVIAFTLSQRLFIKVREQKGTIYKIHIHHDAYAHVGCFFVEFKTKNGNVADILRAFKQSVAELTKLTPLAYKAAYSAFKKKKEVEHKSNPTHASLLAVKEELYCAKKHKAILPADGSTFLAKLFDPWRLAYIVRTRSGNRNEIEKILGIKS